MAKKEAEPVGLHRDAPRRRRIPVWLIGVVLVILVIGAGAAWIFRNQIAGVFEPQPTQPPPPPGAGESGDGVLFQSDFEGDVSADWEPVFNNGRVSTLFENGGLVVNVNSLNDEGTWLAMNYTYTDFVLDVDATKTAGPDDQSAIVLFRLQDDANYYRFDVSFDGFYSLSKAVGGQPILISDWNSSPAIQTGNSTNQVRITAQGSMIEFQVNGQTLPLCVSPDPSVQPIWDNSGAEPACIGGEVVTVWESSDFPRGKIGLGAQGFIGMDENLNPTPAEATISFDNLVIRPPETAP